MDNLNLSEYDDDYLAHYGVLGMKWGVRKDKADRLARKTLKSEYKSAKKEHKTNLKTARKNVKRRSKTEVNARTAKHANALIQAALIDKQSLIGVKTKNVMQLKTGKEFLDDIIARNGLVDTTAKLIQTDPKGFVYDNRYHRDAVDASDSIKINKSEQKLYDARKAYKGK